MAMTGYVNLIQLLYFDSLVIFFEDLFVIRSIQRHTVSTDLAHADAMSPPPAIEHDAENFTLRIPLDIKREQAITQTQQRAQPERAKRAAPAGTDDLRHHGAF